ncbi:MAG TPA: alpha/beta hydrolase-fold protein [Jatrophihabitans sp.]|nr:alpha/beta hydrolase-fold protein [Jatrophihabitans sp.]
MGLTDAATLAVAILLLLTITGATLTLWGRLDRLAARWPLRVLLIGTCQLAAVLVTGLVLNNAFVFYQSWSELLGTHPRSGFGRLAAGSVDAGLRSKLLADYHAGRGTLISVPVPGIRSGVHAGPATVYLPPQYGDPAYANRSFPVLELTSGFPATPNTWIRVLHLDAELNYLIDTGRSAPFIAVVPVQNVASPRDTECVNVVGGPQVDSYLSYDVRTAVERSVRASTAGSQWTVLGDSTGGYCALDLSLRHPEMFAAAVSIAGYDTPAHDATTGNLFGNDPALAALYSPLWLVRHRPLPDLHLLLISTRADRYPTRAARQLAAAVRPPLQVSLLTLPRGGHNFGTFAAEVPVGVSWLSRFVAAPLAPLPTVDGLLPQLVQPPPANSNTPVVQRNPVRRRA